MDVEVLGRAISTLPADDDHPYRTGPWRPQTVERSATYDRDDCAVIGDDPGRPRRRVPAQHREPGAPGTADLPSVRRRRDGARGGLPRRDRPSTATDSCAPTGSSPSRRRAGRCGPVSPRTRRAHRRRPGGAPRTRMKDASSTDVVMHNGVALTSFYQCGDLYRLSPTTLETLGKADWHGRFPSDVGVSAHPKLDARTGELLFFNYSTQAPYLHYGVVDAADELVHYVDVPLPGPRLPHDMAFTPNYTDPERPSVVLGSARARGRQVRRPLPSRAAVALRGDPAARHDRAGPLVRGRADLRAALGQRLRGRRRDRPRRVLPGRPGTALDRRHSLPADVPVPRQRAAADPPAPVAAEPGDRVW